MHKRGKLLGQKEINTQRWVTNWSKESAKQRGVISCSKIIYYIEIRDYIIRRFLDTEMGDYFVKKTPVHRCMLLYC